jgi:predicted acetyltransferase
MEVRIIDESEVGGFIAVMENAFGFELAKKDRKRWLSEFELDRMFGAFDGGQVVGTGGAFSFELTVPGGTVGCGGTTVIAVMPTHRRRGVLTEMMRFHLDEVADRGEPLAALWASESLIYGRYGYGIATRNHRTKMARARASFPRPPLGSGTVRLLDPKEAKKLLPALYERMRPERPGFLSRSPQRWRVAHFWDPPQWRGGGTPQRWALYEEEGEPHGYVAYRQHENWESGLAANRVTASALYALTAAAEDALWRYLLGIDLVQTVEAWNTDPDSVLPFLVADSRRVERTISDGMWVRILNVPAALEARRYRVDGRLVFEVTDPFWGRSTGTYVLEGGPDGAVCRPGDGPPDLRLDVRELGAAYLGGTPFAAMGRAGLVGGEPEALERADLMFGWHRQPWCPEVF